MNTDTPQQDRYKSSIQKLKEQTKIFEDLKIRRITMEFEHVKAAEELNNAINQQWEKVSSLISII